ncbi:MAG: acyl carrier protein [Desulfobacterales bacterium]|nr:acyl carrier protein [Desulfobacterales bacterium]
MSRTRQDIEAAIYRIFQEQFEIQDPGPDEDLREVHGFDSIDAIELLMEIEKLFQVEMDQETKKDALSYIRTINGICDYIEQVLFDADASVSRAANR